MKQNKLKSSIRKLTPQKRRAVAEVISSLLLVVITVVGAVILMTFLDDSFVAGGLAASGGDNSLKSLKLIAYDTRDGIDLFDYPNLDNNALGTTDQYLCRNGDLAVGCFENNKSPANNGTEYVVIQIENRGINPIYLKDVYLDNVGHVWDSTTSGVTLVGSAEPSTGAGEVPRDGMFSILPPDGVLKQNKDNQIQGGQTVTLIIKLDHDNPDIPLSKTIRVQLNIGTNTLQEFLIESGGAQ